VRVDVRDIERPVAADLNYRLALGDQVMVILSRKEMEAAGGDRLCFACVDLVIGSGISFRERASAQLKGVPGTWRMLEVTSRGG